MGSDVLILTIYFLVVIYVLYQMALSLEAQQKDQIIIEMDSDQLLEEVEEQLAYQSYPDRIKAKISTGLMGGFGGKGGFGGMGGMSSSLRQLELRVQTQRDPKLRGTVGVTVSPLGRLPLGPPIRYLSVQVSNRAPDVQVYLDWDRSSITFMSPQSQRVIRVLPNMNLDLTQPQVFSVVNPAESLRMDVTTERCFSRDAETQRLEPRQPLINVAQISGLLTPKTPETDGPSMQKSLYSLNLMVGIRRIADQDSQTSYLLLPFSFDMSLLPGEIAFPPVRWLLSRPRRSAEDFWSNLIFGRPSNSRR